LLFPPKIFHLKTLSAHRHLLSAQNIVFKELIGKIFKDIDLPTFQIATANRAVWKHRGDAGGIVQLADC
jgi:hypothetical protein